MLKTIIECQSDPIADIAVRRRTIETGAPTASKSPFAVGLQTCACVRPRFQSRAPAPAPYALCCSQVRAAAQQLPLSQHRRLHQRVQAHAFLALSRADPHAPAAGSRVWSDGTSTAEAPPVIQAGQLLCFSHQPAPSLRLPLQRGSILPIEVLHHWPVALLPPISRQAGQPNNSWMQPHLGVKYVGPPPRHDRR